LDESPEPIEVPITDILDLHPFRPQDVPSIIREYVDSAYEKGLVSLRIIHGRGKGVQRQTVRNILERDSRVIEVSDAPGESGGWGASCVTLRKKS
jgi:dsDNA-specific endonuclease/ATPase MutS2